MNKRSTLIVVFAALLLLVGAAAMQVRAGSGDGWLGVYIQNVDEDIADAEDLESTDGVLITSVIDKSPADRAGLRGGDVILEYNGRNARSVSRLTRMIDNTEPGEEVELRVWRNGRERTVKVEIGEDDDDRVVYFGRGDFDFDFDEPNVRVKVPDIHVEVPSPSVYGFSTGQLSTSKIGVMLHELSDQLAKAYDVKGGALIDEVVDDSPAEKAGLRAGDVIFEMNGRRVDDIADIREAIHDEDGKSIAVTVKRNGSEKKFDVGIERTDTWSGIGAPRTFRVQPRGTHSWQFYGDRDEDDDDIEWKGDVRENLRDAMRELRRESRNWGRSSDDADEWREQLQDAMKELRKELEELREELEDLDDGR